MAKNLVLSVCCKLATKERSRNDLSTRIFSRGTHWPLFLKRKGRMETKGDQSNLCIPQQKLHGMIK